jgi:hypothetical protein
MALVKHMLGDHHSATHWANKVLTFQPDAQSDDMWGRAAAEFVAPGGEERVARMLGEPTSPGSWEEIKRQMNAIIAATKNT